MIGPAASMRPRVFPAEDSSRRKGDERGRPASMRPRVFPAEDSGAELELIQVDGMLQ